MNTKPHVSRGGAPDASPPTRRTPVAFLGTLGHLHHAAVRYDLDRLRALVEAIEPDLLGIEAGTEAWESGDGLRLPVEVRDAVLPAARLTDTVIVPLGESSPLELAPLGEGNLAALRAALIRAGDRLLAGVARRIDDPRGMTRGAYAPDAGRRRRRAGCRSKHRPPAGPPARCTRVTSTSARGGIGRRAGQPSVVRLRLAMRMR